MNSSKRGRIKSFLLKVFSPSDFRKQSGSLWLRSACRPRHSPFFFNLSLALSSCLSAHSFSALRDFNCHIETICICCHMVPRTANEKSEGFLSSQWVQTPPGCRPADRGVSASWLGCLGLLPQLLFEKHDGPLLVLPVIFRLLPDSLQPVCCIKPLALP